MGLFDFLRGRGARPDWVPNGKRGRTGTWLLMQSPSGVRHVMRPRQGWSRVRRAMLRARGPSHPEDYWDVLESYDNETGRRESHPRAPASVTNAKHEARARRDRQAERREAASTRRAERDRKRQANEAKAQREHQVMEEIEASYRRGRL